MSEPMDQRAFLLAGMVTAYSELLDAVVPESQYWQGEREDTDRVTRLSTAMDQAAARLRELDDEAPGEQPE